MQCVFVMPCVPVSPSDVIACTTNHPAPCSTVMGPWGLAGGMHCSTTGGAYKEMGPSLSAAWNASLNPNTVATNAQHPDECRHWQQPWQTNNLGRPWRHMPKKNQQCRRGKSRGVGAHVVKDPNERKDASSKPTLQKHIEEAERLTCQLNQGGAEAGEAAASLKGQVRSLSLDRTGCRVVQNAFDNLKKQDIEELACEMKGHVREFIESEHANFVIAKFVEVSTAEQVDFVVGELLGAACDVACHRYGCRIIIRLVQHAGSDALIEELLSMVEDLSARQFGHLVVEAILEHGTEEQRACIADILYANLTNFNARIQSRGFRRVMDAALKWCSRSDQMRLARGIFNKDCLMMLAPGRNSHVLVSAALKVDVHNDWEEQALKQLMDLEPKLASSKQGRHMLKELGMCDVEDAKTFF